jgi:hypothetical protein
MRFLLSYANGLDALRADLSFFVRGYLAELFTLEFVASLLLALLIWHLSGRFLDLLEEIGLDPLLAFNEGAPPISDAIPAHQRLVSLIFSIGIGLVILTALARLNFQAIVSYAEGTPKLELNRLSGVEAGALLYFVFGLALLSLSRLMSLQTHWNRSRIPVSSNNLVGQWARYSVLFLLLLAVVVSLLPASDSLGLFSVLRIVIGYLFGILFFIGQLIMVLLYLIFGLPFLLLRGEPLTSLPSAPPLPAIPTQPVSPAPSSEIWQLLKSIILWGALLSILIFSLIRVIRQHDGILAALHKSRVTNWLILAWQWLYRNVSKTRGTLSRVIVEGWQNILSRLEGKRVLPPVNWINYQSLDSRRRILFFYLAMIRRAAEQGLARKPSQTPSEYALTLEKALPSAREDIDLITEAFVEARYSGVEIDVTKADAVKAVWGRIRTAFRMKSNSKKSDHK